MKLLVVYKSGHTTAVDFVEEVFSNGVRTRFVPLPIASLVVRDSWITVVGKTWDEGKGLDIETQDIAAIHYRVV
jgi:hypothetical protein